MKNEEAKNRKFYLDLPYTVVLRKNADGDWIAKIEELEGCIAHGAKQTDALSALEEIKAAWIDDALEVGDHIPVPDAEESLPSGKWVQRVPKSLHKKLTEMAKREGSSLNQFATAILAEAVGRKGPAPLHFSDEERFYRGRKMWQWKFEHDAVWTIKQPAIFSILPLESSLKHIAAISAKHDAEEDVSKKELAYQA
jgi:antitoxin HicB